MLYDYKDLFPSCFCVYYFTLYTQFFALLSYSICELITFYHNYLPCWNKIGVEILQLKAQFTPSLILQMTCCIMATPIPLSHSLKYFENMEASLNT